MNDNEPSLKRSASAEPSREHADDDGPDNRNLADALAQTIEARWAGRRSEHSLPCQARKGVAAVALACRPDLADCPNSERLKLVRVHEIKPKHIKAAIRAWKEEGAKPRLINRRLVCMSAIGISVKGNYQRVPKELKWWLKPDAQAVLVKQLTADGDHEFVDYVEWATSTGFRVEETLRLTRGDFSEAITKDEAGNEVIRVLVTVPGLKTYDAQATLPLSPAAEAVYRRRFAPDARAYERLFGVPYWKLAEKWRRYKHIIGAGTIPGATLKAFRRVSARNLHIGKSMPLDLVRHYLRHSDIATTMGYLRLTGGYSTDEFARYL